MPLTISKPNYIVYGPYTDFSVDLTGVANNGTQPSITATGPTGFVLRNGIYFNASAGTVTYSFNPGGTGTVTFTNPFDGTSASLQMVASSPVVSAVPVADPSFESSTNVATAPNKFTGTPSPSGWIFSTNGAGVATNGSAYGENNAPDGSNVGYIQGAGGTISQAVPNWPAGTYQASFQAAQRLNPVSNLDFQVLVDGTVVGTFQPSGPTFGPQATPNFTVTAGSHTITFKSLNTAGGDNTAFIDAVAIVAGSSLAVTGQIPQAGPPAPTSIALSGPASGVVGQAATFTISLDHPAGPGGVSVAYSASVAGDTLAPASPQVIPSGSSSATFTDNASTVGNRTLTATATGLTSGTLTYNAAAAVVPPSAPVASAPSIWLEPDALTYDEIRYTGPAASGPPVAFALLYVVSPTLPGDPTVPVEAQSDPSGPDVVLNAVLRQFNHSRGNHHYRVKWQYATSPVTYSDFSNEVVGGPPLPVVRNV